MTTRVRTICGHVLPSACASVGASGEVQELDVLIVGAGFAGLYAIHKLRQLGLRIRALDAADDLGGTWHHNRYPGCRCDIPSIEYSYSFSEELQQDWTWSEFMASQPEILRYAHHVADRFDLRRDIQLRTRVVQLTFSEESNVWIARTDGSHIFQARFVLMATGSLSVPNTPQFPGAEDFAGDVYHTGAWPHEYVDFTGLHVGVLGTGSSGTQCIPEIAKQARRLTVFQRTPNYTLPSGNRPLTTDFVQNIKGKYQDIRSRARESWVGFTYPFGGAPAEVPTRKILKSTEEERIKLLDELGFGAVRQWVDTGIDMEANEMLCDLYREQVRRIIKDPKTAEGLMPRKIPYGCKRPVYDQGYYETFNRDNVTLVDLRVGGIERITSTGVQTSQGHFDLDVLVYATGFDAMTGALTQVDIRGRGGETLTKKWQDGPTNYLGLQVHGFPNLFTVTGPGSPSVLTNVITSIEQHIEWITDCIAHMNTNGLRFIEATAEAETDWVAHSSDVAEGSMFVAPSCNSWYLGANIPGKRRVFMPYLGGHFNYRQKCDEVAAAGYEGFHLR